ncbi:hypothetical protein [Campylobacter cuniculorum]|uniref:Site-specific DNA-methyltransferase n=1 Tax=Campylobacter cuniculorum TaxID=374106 RepID=A0ABX6U0T5_9BACT|nr:hypothetical protein [Campylobacter cuniculorum]QOR04940.1 hypothetical protein A0071_03110 [Campylobacter cuniculorum]
MPKTTEKQSKSAEFGTQNYKIFKQDCRSGLRELEDYSIDFIVTDPPYFIDGMNDEWNDRELENKVAKSGVIAGNVIPQCQVCNRPDRDRCIYEVE